MVELSAADKDAIVKSVEEGIIAKLKDPKGPLIVAVDVTAAKLAKDERDPYRSLLQFLTGLLAFCLTLLVALFAALGADKGHAITSLVSSVLMGMAATALVGTIAIFFVQISKSFYPDKFGTPGWIGLVIGIGAVVLGGVTVSYCVDGALLIAKQQCIAKPTDGLSEQAVIELLGKDQESRVTYAKARMSDCFATGDLASSAAWSKIAVDAAKPAVQSTK